jgi:hypothetical protein
VTPASEGEAPADEDAVETAPVPFGAFSSLPGDLPVMVLLSSEAVPAVWDDLLLDRPAPRTIRFERADRQRGGAAVVDSLAAAAPERCVVAATTGEAELAAVLAARLGRRCVGVVVVDPADPASVDAARAALEESAGRGRAAT